MTEKERFRDSLSFLVRHYKGTLTELAGKIWGKEEEGKEGQKGKNWPKYLRKLLSEGSPRRKDSHANGPALRVLHKYWGLEFGELWEPLPEFRFGKLLESIPATEEGQAFLAEIREHVRQWERRLPLRKLMTKPAPPPPAPTTDTSAASRPSSNKRFGLEGMDLSDPRFKEYALKRKEYLKRKRS